MVKSRDLGVDTALNYNEAVDLCSTFNMTLPKLRQREDMISVNQAMYDLSDTIEYESASIHAHEHDYTHLNPVHSSLAGFCLSEYLIVPKIDNCAKCETLCLSGESRYKLGLIDSNHGTGLTRSSIYRWLDGSFPEWSAWPENSLEADTGEDCVYVEGE